MTELIVRGAKRSNKEFGWVSMGLWVKPELKAQIQEEAVRTGTNCSHVVRQAIARQFRTKV